MVADGSLPIEIGLSRYDERQIPDYDQHYNMADSVMLVPSYECDTEAGTITIQDPAWGEAIIGDWKGDEIFVELYQHPVFQRLAGIEQLTLPKQYATMPDSFEFTRWEHAWGSVVFVRKMIREAEERGRIFDDREKLILQLRTIVSDAAHTAFSHMGDWLRQGFGGAEDSHDEDLMEYLEKTGVSDILRRHEIAPEEVVFPDTSDWVECDSPDLCVDRVDYIVREAIRWLKPNPQDVWREAFMINDQNQLVMKSEELAAYFGMASGLLATEHWVHPVHRLQLQLFADMVRGAVVHDDEELIDTLHPIDKLYTIDSMLVANMRQIGDLNYVLSSLMLTIGRDQRRIYDWNRREDVGRFLRAYQVDTQNFPVDKPEAFPHPLDESPEYAEYTGSEPQFVELVPVDSKADVADFGQQTHTYDVYLPPLKARGVDPPYVHCKGGVARLSEENSNYASMLEQQRAIQGQAYVARVHLAPKAIDRLKSKIDVVREKWSKAMSAERIPEDPERFREKLHTIGMIAVSGSANIIRTKHGLQNEV